MTRAVRCRRPAQRWHRLRGRKPITGTRTAKDVGDVEFALGVFIRHRADGSTETLA